jgi:hypothetical protein
VSYRRLEEGAGALAVALVAAQVASALLGRLGWVLLGLCLLVFINGTRRRRWWIQRRVLGRRFVCEDGSHATGVIKDVLLNQPGVRLELEFIPPLKPSHPSIRSRFWCPLEHVSFIAPERWLYWLPKRFDTR